MLSLLPTSLNKADLDLSSHQNLSCFFSWKSLTQPSQKDKNFDKNMQLTSTARNHRYYRKAP